MAVAIHLVHAGSIKTFMTISNPGWVVCMSCVSVCACDCDVCGMCNLVLQYSFASALFSLKSQYT